MPCWRMRRLVRGGLSSGFGNQAKRRERLYPSRLGGKQGQGPAGRAPPAPGSSPRTGTPRGRLGKLEGGSADRLTQLFGPGPLCEGSWDAQSFPQRRTRARGCPPSTSGVSIATHLQPAARVITGLRPLSAHLLSLSLFFLNSCVFDHLRKFPVCIGE